MDAELLALVNQTWAHPALDVLMALLSTLGIVAVLAGTYRAARERGEPRGLTWVWIVTGLAVVLFYYLAARPRPVAVRLLLPLPPTPSFPSGHMALAAAAVTWYWLRRGRRGVPSTCWTWQATWPGCSSSMR